MKEIEGKIENATRELKDKVIPSSISAQTAQTMDLKTLPLQYEIKGVKESVSTLEGHCQTFMESSEAKVTKLEAHLAELQELTEAAEKDLKQQLEAMAKQLENPAREPAAADKNNAEDAGKVEKMEEKLDKLEDLVSTMAEGIEDDEIVQQRLAKLEAALFGESSSPASASAASDPNPPRKLNAPPSASLQDDAPQLETVQESSDDEAASRPTTNTSRKDGAKYSPEDEATWEDPELTDPNAAFGGRVGGESGEFGGDAMEAELGRLALKSAEGEAPNGSAAVRGSLEPPDLPSIPPTPEQGEAAKGKPATNVEDDDDV